MKERYSGLEAIYFLRPAKRFYRLRRSPLRVCAVTRWRLPVGASPTRQPLQPEATGAIMEVMKWLKPSDSVSRYPVTARVISRGMAQMQSQGAQGLKD